MANRMPVEHARSEILVNGGAKDPFLYNPRLKPVEAGRVSASERQTIWLRWTSDSFGLKRAGRGLCYPPEPICV